MSCSLINWGNLLRALIESKGKLSEYQAKALGFVLQPKKTREKRSGTLMSRSLINRGDLLRALIENKGKLSEHQAKALGFVPKPKKSKKECKPEEINYPGNIKDDNNTYPQNLGEQSQPKALDCLASWHFWQAIYYKQEIIKSLVSEQKKHVQMPQRTTQYPPPKAPEYQYLAPMTELIPRIRQTLSKTRPARSYDITQIVRRMGQGKYLAQLPKQHRVAWGASLYVLGDRSDHLAPYIRDQAMVQTQLKNYYPDTAFFPALYNELVSTPQVLMANNKVQELAPQVGDQVLILSDLGYLAEDGGRSRDFWFNYGKKLKAQGVHLIALLPFNPSICSIELAQYYQLLSWEHPAPPVLSETQKTQHIDFLLQQLAIVPRVEPGMLRAIRLSLGAIRYPACLESCVWQHALMDEADMVSTALQQQETTIAYRSAFNEDQDETQRLKSASQIKQWSQHLPYELWLESVLKMSPAWADESKSEQGIISSVERKHACELLNYLAHTSTSSTSGSGFSEHSWGWLEGFIERIDDNTKDNNEEACRSLQTALSDRRTGSITPRNKKALPFSVYQQAEGLLIEPLQSTQQDSPIALINSENNRISIRDYPFWQGNKPEYVVDWGADEYGCWATFQVNTYTQKMRWIPVGDFIMGSPKDEPGYRNNEAPQHKVTFAQGYWIFDTPVTQALWFAVMGKNPSEFKSPNRPVEQVSWEDCKDFITQFNNSFKTLQLSLPSEAQWEYACRAGSDTALYHSDIKILGERNAPALDAIAWYGGNSGVLFELDNGYDSSNWKEQQYPHKRSGTHPVAEKSPNQWGLYDMLGNVWEWTEDHYHSDYQNAPDTGDAWCETDKEAGEFRVVRGGSWGNSAMFCRSALRGADWRPDERYSRTGFRCVGLFARVQSSSGAEPVSPRVFIEAEPINYREKHAGRQLGYLSLPWNNKLKYGTIEQSRLLVIQSDREQLLLQRIYKPRWVNDMGRDRYGLWLQFSVHFEKETVQQKMRWINPGYFMMGSSEDEKETFRDEKPIHPVIINIGFWCFDTPVTQALWQAVMADNPSRFKNPEFPVEKVGWEDSNVFIKKLNAIIPDLKLALPTEAQWEYACRAATNTENYLGDSSKLETIAWYKANSEKTTHSVAQKAPNPWGLYDMLGNVWEWTEDHWHSDYQQAPDNGQAWLDSDKDVGESRILRGSSWNNTASSCRSARRINWVSGIRYSNAGFRCVGLFARVQE